MERESKTYVIYNVMPPYAKATGASASETHANPSSSAPSIESANQEHVLKQSKSENVRIRTEKATEPNLCTECCISLCIDFCTTVLARICAIIIIFIIAGIIVLVITYIKRND